MDSGAAVTWAWIITLAVIGALIAVDLLLSRRVGGGGLRAAAILSGLWVAAGLAFGAAAWLWRGQDAAGEYVAGYLLEKALSIDNIFVFVLLFSSLAVPPALQRRVLYLGVVGALVLRAGFITAGGALIEHFSWIFYVFGAMVLLAGVRMLRAGDSAAPGTGVIVRGLRRLLPVSDGYDGRRFLTRSAWLMATPLLLALIAIEATDVVFALDSIPAVFGVTRDLFVVFTSNAFAVLGLRALYFLLAGSMERFPYLRQGLAMLLVFIGVKMLVPPFVRLPVALSLAVIVAVVGGAIAASLWHDRGRARRRPPPVPNEPVRE